MYFRNLDGFRFIAALFVIIGHCQHILFDAPTQLRAYSPWAEKLAGFGVDFFFVLSGFLISFLLFQEIEKTQYVDIKRFYIRRILRLWPLYFIVGIISILFASPLLMWLGLVNHSQHWPDIGTNLFFLATFSINFQTLLGYMNDYSSPLLGHFWSLAVEEQFYLLWAPLIFVFRKKITLIVALMLLIGAYVTFFPPSIFSVWYGNNAWATPIFFPIHRCFHFGLGALIALLVIRNTLFKLPKFVSIILQVAVLIPICDYLFGVHFYEIGLERIIQGVIAAILILIAISSTSMLPFEVRWMKYFGKVSFGIYIFHIVAIRVVFKLLLDAQISPNSTLFLWLFPVLSSILSVGLAILSYEFIEKKFLALKSRF